MKAFKCEEIMCTHCVDRIHKGLESAKIPHEINLEAKSVTLPDDTTLPQALEILDDLGFSPVEM
ncbi:MAG: metal-binding protein [Oscillospiraceae bacterium]